MFAVSDVDGVDVEGLCVVLVVCGASDEVLTLPVCPLEAVVSL
jgi:hypothetical protein